MGNARIGKGSEKTRPRLFRLLFSAPLPYSSRLSPLSERLGEASHIYTVKVERSQPLLVPCRRISISVCANARNYISHLTPDANFPALSTDTCFTTDTCFLPAWQRLWYRIFLPALSSDWFMITLFNIFAVIAS